jgi:hypothetical protein
VPPYTVILLNRGTMGSEIAGQTSVWPFEGTDESPGDLVRALNFTSLLLRTGAAKVVIQDGAGVEVLSVP